MALAATGDDLSGTIVKDLAVSKLPPVTDGPIKVGEQVRLDGTFDSNGKKVKAGDFFAVQFPPELTAPKSTFPLKDDDGNELADCVSGGDANEIRCTFNETAAKREFVKGSFFTIARAAEATEKVNVEFIVGTTVTLLALPGGGGIKERERGEMPTESSKYGWQGDDNSKLNWELQVPASVSSEGEPVKITDSLSGGATYAPGTEIAFAYYEDAAAHTAGTKTERKLKEGKNSFDLADGTKVDYTLTFSENRGSYELNFLNFDPNADGIYYLTYESSLPAEAVSGTEYSNTATINGVQKVWNQEWKNLAGGDINGPGFGGLLVSKVATGDTDALASGQEFTVLAKWTDREGIEQQREITVTPGGKPGSLQQIPMDTVVTLTEVKNPIEGATYDETFSSNGDNVTIEGDGKTAKVTIGDRTQTNLRLTNKITKDETPPTNTPTEEPTDTPTEEPTDTPTEEPTDTPTQEPTDTPTEEPTDTPTEEPTDTPTQEPTDTPTEEPTDTPTEEPTDTPTQEPTDTPTEEPTDTPTEEPTDTPTEEPTDTPTEEPTDTPTTSPTVPWSNPTSTPTPGSPSPNQPGNPGNPGNGTTGGGTGGSNTGNSSTGGGSLSRTGMEFPLGLLAAGIVTLAAGVAMRRASSRKA